MSESRTAIRQQDCRNTVVFPIIVRPCLWHENSDISKRLAFPTDGKPITSYSDHDEAWVNVVQALTSVIDEELHISFLELTEDFSSFLKSTDLLSQSHSAKETLELNDIFVYPHLRYHDGLDSGTVYNSKRFEDDLLKLGDIVISGDNQSGKTALCKRIFHLYRCLNLVPIYIQDDNRLLGNPMTRLRGFFEDQYDGESYDSIPNDRIVPIIDDFHTVNKKDKFLKSYDLFQRRVIVVDDIHNLDIRHESLLTGYNRFSIKEYPPSLRDELLSRWIALHDGEYPSVNPNQLYIKLDDKTDKIDKSLGKVLGEGVMPSYPFFILNILSTYELGNQLDQEITSQGHCYQALIYLNLRRNGVESDQIDIYLNFLTELSFEIFSNNSTGLTQDELDTFISNYESVYNLPLRRSVLLSKLSESGLSRFTSLGHYHFCYSYIFYFFAAKYLAENMEANRPIIDNIINNLHKNENAYISVFISHHSKSDYLLDEILVNAIVLFDDVAAATLDSNQLSFFDDHEEYIVKAVLPPDDHNPSESRNKILVGKDELEKRGREKSSFDSDLDHDQISDSTEKLIVDLRRSVKTVEVIGQIIRNRSGSLELDKLEKTFEAGLLVYLRILSSFFHLIKDRELEGYIINFIVRSISSKIEEEGEDISVDKLEKLARELYWNLNFNVIYGFITKAIRSLGSVNLIKVSRTVTERIDSPASFIVHHGIKMWFQKSLDIDEISDKVNERSFSKTASKLLRHKIVEHSMLHYIHPKDISRIHDKMRIPRLSLMQSEN